MGSDDIQKGRLDVKINTLDCRNGVNDTSEDISIFTVEIVVRRTSDVKINEDKLRDLLRRKREEVVTEISSLVET